MTFGANDIPTFFAEFGEVVTFGAFTCKGNFSKADGTENFGEKAEINADAFSLLFPTAALPGLKVRSAITVGSTAYIVTDSYPVDDGQITHASLRYA